MLSSTEVNHLGDILNNTWGSSNYSDGRSISGKMKDDVLSLTFHTIVHFASETALREQTKSLSDESNQILASKVSEVKSKFKNLSGSALKLKEMSDNDTLELISSTVNSPRKIALYRRTITLQIQN